MLFPELWGGLIEESCPTFARVKRSGLEEYPQVVRNRREGTKTLQRVIAAVGRMDRIQEKGEIDNPVCSLSRFSEKDLLILSRESDIRADAEKIGSSLICEQIRKKLKIGKIVHRFLKKGEILSIRGIPCRFSVLSLF